MESRLVDLQAVHHMLKADAQMAASLKGRLELMDKSIELMLAIRKETGELFQELFPDNFKEVRINERIS